MITKTIYFEDADHPDTIVRKRVNAHALEYISKQNPSWKQAAPNSSYEREFYLGEGNCCLFSITYDEAKERLAQGGVKI